jgi:transketolase
MRNALVNTLLERSKVDPTLAFLTADLGFMAVEPLAEALEKRFINCGVAEANMVGVAAGLCIAGYYPFLYTMAPFITMRCLEQIRVSLCQNRHKAVLIGVAAGYSYGAQGASHHSIEDVAPMLSLPGMTVIVPSDPLDVQAALRAIDSVDGPVYLRLAKAGEPIIGGANRKFELGKISIIKEGEDASIFAMGDILAKVVSVAERLEKEGINLGVYNCHTLKPFDSEFVVNVAAKTRKIFTVEQHVLQGGLSALVSMSLSGSRIPMKAVRFLTIKDRYVKTAGDKDYLETLDGLSEDGIYQAILSELTRC